VEPASTPAIVIGVKDYGESDKIVTFYSLSRGRMAGIAKGAKRSLKRFVNKLELFSLLELFFSDSRSSSLVRLDQADLLDPFPALRENYDRYTAAALICELTFHWTRENDPDPNLFSLLAWSLKNIEDLKRPAPWGVVLFQIKMLTLLGYQPDLNGCTECGSLSPRKAPYRFSSARNGLVCTPCARPDNRFETACLPISLSTSRFLHKAQEMDTSMLPRLRFSREAVEESIALLRSYSSTILQRDINSWDQLVKTK